MSTKGHWHRPGDMQSYRDGHDRIFAKKRKRRIIRVKLDGIRPRN
jgi:hypothetical protein